MKVKHVREGSRSYIQVETVNQIYNQRFQKYLDHFWIQKSIIQNVASRIFKTTRDQLSHINRPHCMHNNKRCWFRLGWFCKKFKILYFIIATHEHAIVKFLDLLQFLGSWVIYREEKAYPWWGQNTLHQIARG
jgi:hypothetical protein